MSRRCFILPAGVDREDLVAQLVEAAVALAATRIMDPLEGLEYGVSYCYECNRAPIAGRPIEHAASCRVGKVTSLVTQLSIGARELERLRAASEQLHVGLREGLAEPEIPVAERLTDRERALVDLRSGVASSDHSYIQYQDPPVRMTHEEAARRSSTVVPR